MEDRRKLLDEVYRVCKAEALVLVYPKHMESTAMDEIEKANLPLKTAYSGTLVHDNRHLQKGQVLIFVKE
jgi:hypothetical protein